MATRAAVQSQPVKEAIQPLYKGCQQYENYLFRWARERHSAAHRPDRGSKGVSPTQMAVRPLQRNLVAALEHELRVWDRVWLPYAHLLDLIFTDHLSDRSACENLDHQTSGRCERHFRLPAKTHRCKFDSERAPLA
jgi:hypothetical protein